MPFLQSDADPQESAQELNTFFMLTLNDFTVQRGEYVLCDKVNLNLASGQICHLVGANGTGKTTLLMQLAGLLPVCQGNISYRGVSGLPAQPLYVSHQLGIHPSLSVSQNLIFLLKLYGIAPSSHDIDAALSWVGLAGYEPVSSSELSAGQTRKVTLARLALMQPKHTGLWLLDEPFTALDVDMIIRLQQRMQQFVMAGGAILMTSHQPVNIATMHLNLADFILVSEIDSLCSGWGNEVSEHCDDDDNIVKVRAL